MLDCPNLMKVSLFSLLIALAVLVIGCSARPVQSIPSIKSIQPTGKNTVTITTTNGFVRMIRAPGLLNPPSKSADSCQTINLKIGESFTVSDMYHAWSTYTLRQVSPESIILKEIHYSHPPDSNVRKNSKTISVSPY